MKRKVVVIIVIVVALIVLALLGYFGYHAYMLQRYHISYDYEAITEEVSVSAGSTCEQEGFDFSFCLPEGFSYDAQNSVNDMRIYTDEVGRRLSVVPLTDDLGYLFDSAESDNLSFDANSVLEEMGVSNMVELLHYLDEKNTNPLSVFSSIEDIQLNYIASTIANFTLSFGNRRFYITGDYSGYVISHDNQYDVNLCYRGMRYNFSFTGGEFIESDITRFISSVRFD